MSTILKSITLILALALAGACSSEKPLAPLSQYARILAFGDSLTRGKGVKAEHSYPAVLARLIDRQVINQGVSGEVSEQGAKRLPELLEMVEPDLLLLMHGGNDILRSLSPKQAKANIASMIRQAQNLDIPVVLIGIPEKSLFSKTAPFYRELADEFSLVLEDSIISSLLKKPGMKSDSVHFNKAGYAAIAERIKTVLEENGAL